MLPVDPKSHLPLQHPILWLHDPVVRYHGVPHDDDCIIRQQHYADYGNCPAGERPEASRHCDATLTGILFVLKTGLPVATCPAEMGCASGVTCSARPSPEKTACGGRRSWLRLRAASTRVARSWYRAGDRQASYRTWQRPWQVSLGRRTHACLTPSLPSPPHSFRAPCRYSRRVARTRLLLDLLEHLAAHSAVFMKPSISKRDGSDGLVEQRQNLLRAACRSLGCGPHQVARRAGAHGQEGDAGSMILEIFQNGRFRRRGRQ
ncbi:hypothetical protein B7759_01213 [Burkholderia glumae]|nr:transposase [Burkholderia glumae LMG 2196 = ATCC 33617]QKM54332.1 hypothetical protein CG017_02363 [Burkholderia glumae]QTP32640.1 hypothetical protein B7759_01213 [Burkholderia glumae]